MSKSPEQLAAMLAEILVKSITGGKLGSDDETNRCRVFEEVMGQEVTVALAEKRINRAMAISVLLTLSAKYLVEEHAADVAVDKDIKIDEIRDSLDNAHRYMAVHVAALCSERSVAIRKGK